MPKPTMAAALLLLLLRIFPSPLLAQDTSAGTAVYLDGDRAFRAVSGKASAAEERLEKATRKYLSKLRKQEVRLRAKLWRRDSVLANELFAGVEEKYAALTTGSSQPGNDRLVYSARLDSLTVALQFFGANGLSSTALQEALGGLSSLQAHFDQCERVRQFILGRKRLLKASLERLGVSRELKSFQKQFYYYGQQLQAYKVLWEEPSELEKKLLNVVVTSEQFREFFRKNSQLASLFALPGGNAVGPPSTQGLQTRASVQQVLAARFGSGPNVQAMLSQNMQTAQGLLSDLRQKLSQYGSGGVGNGDPELPKGFRPNSQKTKTFRQRLEYGVNVQSQKARSYFPVTSDLGLSLGYKLNDQSSLGVGASYKIGWGRSWNNVRLTSEGVGLRSYLDYKLKGSLYIAGGFEQNYRTAFASVQQLHDYSAWQSSGLFGLSKRYQLSKRFKGDVKLLWDFLSYQQVPRTQAVLFRVGYWLK